MEKSLNDSERLALNVAKLDKARRALFNILENTSGERQKCKDAQDFDNYEVLARISGHLHTALSGVELACAESFNLKTDQVSPRTGGGGK